MWEGPSPLWVTPFPEQLVSDRVRNRTARASLSHQVSTAPSGLCFKLPSWAPALTLCDELWPAREGQITLSLPWLLLVAVFITEIPETRAPLNPRITNGMPLKTKQETLSKQMRIHIKFTREKPRVTKCWFCSSRHAPGKHKQRKTKKDKRWPPNWTQDWALERRVALFTTGYEQWQAVAVRHSRANGECSNLSNSRFPSRFLIIWCHSGARDIPQWKGLDITTVSWCGSSV